MCILQRVAASLLAMAWMAPEPARANAGSSEPASALQDSQAVLEMYEEGLKLYDRTNREHGHFASVNGIKLHYLEWGPPDGVPLIWSHGYASSAFEMVRVAPALAAMGYHLIAISYRAHGQTVASGVAAPNQGFSLATVADDISALMRLQGLQCAVIGGWSLGGGVATTFYENYPDQAVGIVLEDGGGDAVQNRVERNYAEHRTELFSDAWPEYRPFDSRYQAVLANVAMYENVDIYKIAMLLDLVREGADGKWHPTTGLNEVLGDFHAYLNPARNRDLPLLGQSWRRVNPLITYRKLSVPLLIIDPTGDDADGMSNSTPDYLLLKASHPDLVAVVSHADATHEEMHLGHPDEYLADMKAFMARLRAAPMRQCRTSPGTLRKN